MDIDMTELRRQLDRINAVTQLVSFAPPPEEGCTVSYLRVPEVSLEDGLQEGIQEYHDRQRRKAKEQPKLRKGTKHYVRMLRRDGKLLRLDKMDGERLVVLFLSHYEDGVRYMIPFCDDGTPYPAYTYVTHWADGRVSEEYAVSGGQILRWSFDYQPDDTIHVSMVNAVPDGREPVICWKTAIYTPGETITCQDTGYWDSWMTDKEKTT